MLGTALGLVKRSEERESSDTVTGNETTDHSLFPGSHGGGFNSETDHEDDQTEDFGKNENYDVSVSLQRFKTPAQIAGKCTHLKR
jgi:hypothetical protein